MSRKRSMQEIASSIPSVDLQTTGRFDELPTEIIERIVHYAVDPELRNRSAIGATFAFTKPSFTHPLLSTTKWLRKVILTAFSTKELIFRVENLRLPGHTYNLNKGLLQSAKKVRFVFRGLPWTELSADHPAIRKLRTMWQEKNKLKLVTLFVPPNIEALRNDPPRFEPRPELVKVYTPLVKLLGERLSWEPYDFTCCTEEGNRSAFRYAIDRNDLKMLEIMLCNVAPYEAIAQFRTALREARSKQKREAESLIQSYQAKSAYAIRDWDSHYKEDANGIGRLYYSY